MATIYRKTVKGRDEIESRANRLAPRLRMALIMVDGLRGRAELAKLIASADEVLGALAQQGFIEIAAAGVTLAAAPETAATHAAAMAGVPSHLAVDRRAAPRLGTPHDQFANRRHAVARALGDAVGPMGDELSVLIERASDEAALQPLLAMARESIRNIRGRAAAEAFAAQYLG